MCYKINANWYDILPEQPKENIEKITSLIYFLDLDWIWNEEITMKW